MLSNEQYLKIEDKIKIVVKALLSGKKTINEIEKETDISSSSIQRYLNNEEKLKEIYGSDAEFIIEEIKRKLEENKKEGLRKGGINYAKNNNPTNDEINEYYQMYQEMTSDVFNHIELYSKEYNFEALKENFQVVNTKVVSTENKIICLYRVRDDSILIDNLDISHCSKLEVQHE